MLDPERSIYAIAQIEVDIGPAKGIGLHICSNAHMRCCHAKPTSKRRRALAQLLQVEGRASDLNLLKPSIVRLGPYITMQYARLGYAGEGNVPDMLRALV